ncbi:peroxidase family protein [Stieleria neptunia]|nr:peroxidase family protein [Stieleria neptunia]
MHERGSAKSSDSGIPAAYTFFAQFVDHDITLDTTSQLNSTQVQDAASLPNLRSPNLDLDCVYAFGPEASPYLYDGTGRLLVGNAQNPNDVARVVTGEMSGNVEIGRALIGDPRNDENLFVSQLQFAFHLFHNRLMDNGNRRFEEVQRQARFHYQYIVLHDFLRRVCDPSVYRFAIERLYRREPPLFYSRDENGDLPMPVEFSVAAYRFGHSLVRSAYKPNTKQKTIGLFDEQFGTLGFSAVPEKLTVEWKFLFEKGTTNRSRKIDELLTDELLHLPGPVVEDPDELNHSLPFRNLVRGRSLGLPSGQDVARQIADTDYPVESIDLKLESVHGWKGLPPAIREEIRETTPLFFYILRESNVVHKGAHLGPVGSAILMEVFSGVLSLCTDSFLSERGWSPSEEVVGTDHRLTLADVLRYVGRY